VPCKRVSLSIGAPLLYLERVCLPDRFERKEEKHILVPFLDQDNIKILSVGVICNFSKGTVLGLS